ncbi:MAG: DUF488 domain-containing protein [Chloroflexi bacterium]|nr:DUF488 domain-containing protein [Chloroflexota bacterium]
MSDSSPVIYTIGHSNHTRDRSLELMRLHRIDLLIDVSANPRSRFAPWSNRERLQRSLAQCRVDCLWSGDTLGGVPSGPESVVA